MKQAIGVVPGDKNAIKVLSKKTSASNKPTAAITETVYSGGKSARTSVLLDPLLHASEETFRIS